MKSFKDLIVWQRSVELVKAVYKICDELPKHELYALGSQLRRSSISIPSNIAEGYRRRNRKEYVQFCSIAAGSAAETETQLILVGELYHDIKTDQALVLVTEVQKMLYSLGEKLKTAP